MSADRLLEWLTQVPFVLIFLVVAIQAVRHPLRANFDTVLLFGATALVIAIGRTAEALGLELGPIGEVVTASLIMALPYLVLRLVDDFSDVPRALTRFAVLGLAASVVSLLVVAPPRPVGLTLLLVVYFFGLELYAAAAFVREARRSNGVTRRRMQAVAVGSIFLGLTVLMAGFGAGLPELTGVWTVLGRMFAIAPGVGYFVGFAPPRFLRHAWQEPELRGLLGRSASLPRLSSTGAIVRELERGAARSTGAPYAAIGLWDEAAQVLRFHPAGPGGTPLDVLPDQTIAGWAFAEQRTIFSTDAERDDPANVEAYRAYGARAVLAAPIGAGERRLGVLVAYAARAPIFADDDLVLVKLLADQAAVILESRALIDEAARVRAREEATRLKDDFLSAAAHDLKTPLTTVVAQAQLLEWRATLDPSSPDDVVGIRRVIREAKRLSCLVHELLDAATVEQGGLIGTHEAVDLAEIAREVGQRQASDRHRCVVDAPSPVIGQYNCQRIGQLVDNLVENAVKYSPEGGEVAVHVRSQDGEAHLTVTDQGIGIPEADLPHIFDRFHRGGNVDDRRFAGMGLGLYICRGIAEQHGGRIWAVSRPGEGSTFHVALPIAAPNGVVGAVGLAVSAPAAVGSVGRPRS